MKLARLPHDPATLLDFFQEGLESLGAVCERPWHDRLHIIAEGVAATLWNPHGELVEKQIHFPPPDDSTPRQADHEVFPGCPLTFHLAESLSARTLVLERAVLQATESSRPPTPDVAEKLWHLQYPGTTRWRMESNFKAAWHFSLIALARCEIQAIDQHWSLHRLALSLPDGEPDEMLIQSLEFCPVASEPPGPVPWLAPDPAAWQSLLRDTLARELEADLAALRQRQENYLRRELDRIHEYFQGYEQELRARLERRPRGSATLKLEERLAAAKAEHERRRLDQVQRHEIRVIPHLDALVLLAEPAWSVSVATAHRNEAEIHEAVFIPRIRRWKP